MCPAGIDSRDITKAEFKIEPYRDGLVITLVSDEGEIEQLLLETDVHPHIGVDWIRDNGEL